MMKDETTDQTLTHAEDYHYLDLIEPLSLGSAPSTAKLCPYIAQM